MYDHEPGWPISCAVMDGLLRACLVQMIDLDSMQIGDSIRFAHSFARREGKLASRSRSRHVTMLMLRLRVRVMYMANQIFPLRLSEAYIVGPIIISISIASSPSTMELPGLPIDALASAL